MRYRESPEHKAAKERIRDLLRREGWVAENEIECKCYSEFCNKKLTYTVDVIGSKTPRTVILEVDGYKGHSTRNQAKRDRRRDEDIQRDHGRFIEIIRFELSEIQSATDEEILDDINKAL